MAKRKTYTARYERDENDYWAVSADLGRGAVAVSDGQTLPKARKRIRIAIGVLLDVDEDSFDVIDDVVLPAAAKSALLEYKQAQAAEIERILAAGSARSRAASVLIKHGLSRRDAGDLLGLTGQRVQQLLRER